MQEVIFITGASSGIGQAIAIKLAQKGYKNIILHYFKNKKGVEETFSQLTKLGTHPFIVSGDIGNYSDIDQMIAEISKKYEIIDILINNAGELGPYDDLFNIDIQACERTLKANLLGPIYITQKILPLLNKDNGHVLFTSSIHGNPDKGGEEKCIPYCISKAGIDNLVGIWARELAPNIRINAVAPGVTKTAIWDDDSQETIDAMLDKTLIKDWITPEQIADGFLFLIENTAITGEILYIGGGFRP